MKSVDGVGGYAGPLDWLIGTPIAHRGLHDGNQATMENSIGAFRAAILAGYAIECDVMLARDRVPIVFHDQRLERLTLGKGRVSDWSSDDLRTLMLGNTRGGIPTVRDLLTLVAGQVPIVMELKGMSSSDDGDFLDALLPVIAGYKGRLALMSFDPWLIDQALASTILPVGLTAEGLDIDALTGHRAIYERGCAFVSYNVHHIANSFIAWVRSEKRDPVITWTVRNAHDVARTRQFADQMTFEGFLPQV